MINSTISHNHNQINQSYEESDHLKASVLKEQVHSVHARVRCYTISQSTLSIYFQNSITRFLERHFHVKLSMKGHMFFGLLEYKTHAFKNLQFQGTASFLSFYISFSFCFHTLHIFFFKLIHFLSHFIEFTILIKPQKFCKIFIQTSFNG